MKVKLFLLTILLGSQGFLFGMGGPGATRGNIAGGTPVTQRQIPTLFELTVGPAAKSMEEKLIAFLNAGGDIPDFVATEIETKIPALLFVPVITRLALKGENLTVAQKLSLLNSVALSSYIEASDKSTLNKLRALLAEVFKGELDYKGDLTKKYFTKINEVEGVPVSSAQTLLHYAITKGDVPLVTFLLDAGLDVNFQSGEGKVLGNKMRKYSKMSPLLWASLLGNTNLVDLLLKYGGDVNLSSLDPSWVPLVIAVLKKNKNLFDLLIKAGADVGRAALDMAYFIGNKDMLEKVLKSASTSKLELNSIYAGYNETLLDAAINEGDQEIINLLRKYGAKTAADIKAGQ